MLIIENSSRCKFQCESSLWEERGDIGAGWFLSQAFHHFPDARAPASSSTFPKGNCRICKISYSSISPPQLQALMRCVNVPDYSARVQKCSFPRLFPVDIWRMISWVGWFGCFVLQAFQGWGAEERARMRKMNWGKKDIYVQILRCICYHLVELFNERDY